MSQRDNVANGRAQREGNFGSGTPASLSVLDERENKKNPTPENISGLKSALADVLKKTETKPEQKFETKQEVKNEKSSGRLKIFHSTYQEKKEKLNEVPEQTLRKVLSMEENHKIT